MLKGVFIFMAAVLVFFTGYAYWFFYRSYSNGYREGYFQKFSQKGNLFKTYEGELVQEGFGKRTGNISGGNFAANYFYFSVVDEAIADSLENCIGKTIKVHYTQYLRSLPWRGDNYKEQNQEKGQYIIDRIESVKDYSR